MIWLMFWLMFSLITSVWMLVVKMSPTFYQTGENDNVTIGWDIQAKADISLANLICFLKSEPPKVLYEMINGVDIPESQHQQFAGRVQLDKDTLREGRVRLHLSTVTADDSGEYRCDLAVNYEKRRKSWGLETSEKFVLKVSQTSDGDNSDVSLGTPTSGPETKGSKHTQSDQHKEAVFLFVFIGAQAAMVLAAFGKMIYQHCTNKDQDSDTPIVQPSEEDNIDTS